MMKSIALTRGSTVSYTLLSDLFVDRYMPHANGEYVKVYIYLLKAIQKNAASFSIQSMAGAFNCSEEDVTKALNFWESEGLLILTREGGEIVSVRLPEIPDESPEFQKDGGESSMPRPVWPQPDGTVSNDRSRTLINGNDENVDVLITIAERYTGRPLSRTDVNRILYLYDELHLSVDLIDYLIEYCVSKNKRSFRYIESVGVRWYNDGIKTVAEAKARASSVDGRFFRILRYFGISGRDPLPNETARMKKWLDTWGFSQELVAEACARALRNTDRQTPGNLFSYTDRILSRWYDARITTLSQVRDADLAHERQRAAAGNGGNTAGSGGNTTGNRRESSSAARRKTAKPNAFNDFEQRDYDFEDLEQKLLEHTKNNGAG